MRPPMSLEDFASATQTSPDDIERYRAAGLLDPNGNGWFDGDDVLRLQAVQRRLRDGVALEEMLDTLRAPGAFSLRLYPSAPVSIEEVAKRTGFTLDQLRALLVALGIDPDQPFDEEAVESLAPGAGLVEAGLPWEAIIEGARVYADSLRRLADANLRMTHRYFCEAMASQGQDEHEIAMAVGSAVSLLGPASEGLVRNLLAEFTREAAIDHALAHLDPDAANIAPGTERATIVFVDVALFSTVADLEGDEAAVRLIDSFDQAARRILIQHGGRLVKQIGDEFMLVFREPATATRFAVDLNEAMVDERVPLRTGIHTGSVVYRLGDYFGSAVNVAARITSMAMPNSIIITEPVAKAAANEGIAVEEIGVRSLRGMEEPVALYRVLMS
jgi:adenylate cyclase